MKKSLMYALAVVILDAVAVYSVINSNTDPDIEAYKNAVSEAEQYESQELYYKSIQSYNTALELKESYDIRMKIAELYEKGYENGEIASLEDKYNALDKLVKIYPEDTASYDAIISYLESKGNYSTCSEYVRLARNNNVSSDVIEECYNKIKSMYTEKETTYSSFEDLGTCIAAKRNVIETTDKTDEQGNIVYVTDENGESVPEQEERELIEYTYMYYNDSETEIYTDINMSPPAVMTFNDGTSHKLIFRKGYGNDIASGELSSRIYSRIESDGIRQCYVGEQNEYEAVFPYNNFRIALFNTLTNKYDMFGTSGKKLAEGYDYLGCFSNNVAYSEKDGIKTVINTNGEAVFSKNISSIILGHGGRCSYFNRMFVKLEGDVNFKMINSQDLSDIGFECEDADLFFGEAAAFCKGGKYGFVNDDGSVFIEPEYEGAKSFSNGYAAVKKSGKWGFINRYGDIVVEPVYEEALYMDSNGSAFVFLDGSWRIISLFYIE